MEETQSFPPRPWRFSLLAVFEVLTVIAGSLALHRDPKLPLTAALMLVWSAVSGAYLGYRWTRSNHLISSGQLTMSLSALISLLNAAALSFVFIRRAQILNAGGYSFWQSYWPHIVMIPIIAALIGMTMGGILGAVAAYWREAKTAKSRS